MKHAASESLQVVSFGMTNSTSKKEDYAIPIEQVREIRPVEKITKVPRSEPHVKGIMNLRGIIIPVIDVKEKLGLQGKSNNPKQRILVAEVGNSLTGLLVDDVDQVLRIQTKDIETAPGGELESCHYIKGVIKINERLVSLLDVPSLLGDTKSENLSNTDQYEKIIPDKTPQENTNPSKSEIESLDDIPPELAEVFKEDSQGISPQITKS
jgi:purine-binding chemotaxis protein CheW